MKSRIIYEVRGWDGDPTCFSSKEKAKEEFIGRSNLVNNWECIEKEENEDDIYIVYKSFDRITNEPIFLELEAIPLWEEE